MFARKRPKINENDDGNGPFFKKIRKDLFTRFGSARLQGKLLQGSVYIDDIIRMIFIQR